MELTINIISVPKAIKLIGGHEDGSTYTINDIPSDEMRFAAMVTAYISYYSSKENNVPSGATYGD